jgi:DNA polymerase I-like protein with 3'-5' exonuclease and polymerase domains
MTFLCGFAFSVHAERQAFNTKIQGSAADILKSAMISIDEELKRDRGGRSNVRLSILMHDELMYEVPKAEVNSFAAVLKRCMENAVQLSVTLPVKMKFGDSWGTMEDLIV